MWTERRGAKSRRSHVFDLLLIVWQNHTKIFNATDAEAGARRAREELALSHRDGSFLSI